MNCPACGNLLQEKQVGELTVDVCQGGCGGIWFDNYELKKVDEQHESQGEALLDIERNPSVNVDLTARRKCPKCENITMLQHFVSVKREIAVDECGNCGGIWLDAGELRKIREQYTTDAERSQAAQAYFSEVFDADLMRERQKNEESMAKARRFANIFRFLCPTAYIPGKQSWGAF